MSRHKSVAISTSRPLLDVVAPDGLVGLSTLRNPPDVKDRLDYCVWLERALGALANRDEHPCDLNAAIIVRLRNMRGKLMQDFYIHTNELALSEEGAKAPGWNRLYLVWVLLAHLNCLLGLGRAEVNARDLILDELVLDARPFEAVPRYSLSQLRDAIYVMRRRTEVARRWGPAHAAYLNLLEWRTSHFITMKVEEGAFDVPYWRDEDGPTRHFIVNTCWWFVHLRRASEAERWLRRVDAIPPTIDVEPTWEFLLQVAETYNLPMHKKGFRTRMRCYDVCPDDIDRLSYVKGISGVERVRVEEVMDAEYLPETASYIMVQKYKTMGIPEFVAGLARRRAGGAGWGSGFSSLDMHESVAAIHVFASIFLGRFKLDWPRHFVVLLRHVNEFLPRRISQCLRNGQPFIVQAVGVWYCASPGLLPFQELQAMVPTMDEFEEIMEGRAAFKSREEVRRPTVWYRCETVVDAIAVWATEMLEHHDGRVFGKTEIGIFLKQILGDQ
jgi:hypothetical protein